VISLAGPLFLRPEIALGSLSRSRTSAQYVPTPLSLPATHAPMQIEELPSYVSPACGLDDVARLVQPVEARKAVGLQNAAIVLQMTRRMFSRNIQKLKCSA
jgi:hypothetical protein